MFGAKSMKTKNGKTAVFIWKDRMVFKLDAKSYALALALKGATIASHLYAPEKSMLGWVSIPISASDKWFEFASAAAKYVVGLNNG